MHIDAIDLFYAAMPEVTLAADGSQDALIVRVQAGGFTGWGECEASPLVSIAAFVTPRSHGVCQPVSASVVGEQINGPEDIHRISSAVRRNSMDVLQAAHTFSGIEMALWDVLGQAREEPVWKLLGYDKNYSKTPYASVLFGDTPDETLARGREWVDKGFRAVKFGWGTFGRDLSADADQLQAAREAVGDARLMVDAGQVWERDLEAAVSRLPLLADAGVTWLEEPFEADAYEQYAALAKLSGAVGIAGGEASHTSGMATNLIRYGGIQYVQIDSGRIGGLGPSKLVANFASAAGVAYVNHTFTSHLALAASLQPFAGLRNSVLCEYPASPSKLGAVLATAPLPIDENGEVRAPDAPGLGVSVDLDALRPYLQTVEIAVNGRELFRSL